MNQSKGLERFREASGVLETALKYDAFCLPAKQALQEAGQGVLRDLLQGTCARARCVCMHFVAGPRGAPRGLPRTRVCGHPAHCMMG